MNDTFSNEFLATNKILIPNYEKLMNRHNYIVKQLAF